jgi:oxalate decarboxylase/phosphoglucose isomerase-like protein (cupin superfamily)
LQFYDINQPELLQRFPEAEKAFADKLEVELKEGEVMYIPSYVWHYVENFGTGIYLYSFFIFFSYADH